MHMDHTVMAFRPFNHGVLIGSINGFQCICVTYIMLDFGILSRLQLRKLPSHAKELLIAFCPTS
jgi:hypothetical protein